MYVLATLYALRQHLGLDATDTGEDQRLIDALTAATAAIERHTRRTFQPHYQNIAHDVNLRDVSEVLLKDDLLALSSLTDAGGDIPLASVMQVGNGILHLIDGRAFTYDETPVNALTIHGIWGYHPQWSLAWSDSGDTVQDAPLNASATALTVSDVDAGASPRFQVGQLLRIEEEYLHITAIDTSTNILTVKRGVNGTPATSHAASTPIAIYQVPADISQLTLRWALWLYREPDNFSTSIPPMLAQSLDGLRRLSVKS